MAQKPYPINSLLEEMETWLVFDVVIKNYAKDSKITKENNREFAQLVEGWCTGVFDEDPQYVGDKICNILTKQHNITALSFGCKMR